MKTLIFAAILVFYIIRINRTIKNGTKLKNVSWKLILGELSLLAIVCLQLLDIYNPKFESSELTQNIGYFAFFLGVAFSSISRLVLKNNYVTAAAARSSESIISNGPYRFIRHPVYFGCIVAFFGIEIGLSSILIVLPVMYCVFLILQIEFEEKILSNMHPKEWGMFVKNTRYKLIPFIY